MTRISSPNAGRRRSLSSYVPLGVMIILLLAVTGVRYGQQDTLELLSLSSSNLLEFQPPSPAALHTALSSGSNNDNDNFDTWLTTHFRAADPTEQDWCTRVFREGTYWKHPLGNKGAQFSQDVFVARRLFTDYIRQGRPGVFVEAGANHYKELSSSYFLEKCLGWSGLCIEPQRQYHAGFEEHRSCRLVKECLSKEKTEMMLGGMPAHRGAGMFVKPIPADGVIPDNFERIQCSPVHDLISGHVDLFVLDVEGAEMPVLNAIDWEKNTFGAILIETEKMNAATKKQLKTDMEARGYTMLHELRIDTLFVSSDMMAITVGKNKEIWEPPGDILRLVK